MSVRTGSGAWKLLVDSLGVHRRVTGSAGFDPRRKQWTVILRQVPRSALMAPVRMLHDDTGNGENGQRPILLLLEAKGTPKEAHGSALFCLQDGPAELALEGFNIEELCVVNGADRLFSCLDERFPDLETHDKIGESLDDVFRLKVDKGERTAAYTGRCRELFEKAAREGIELPDVARGYLMLRGARLGPERKAIVLAASGQSYTERNVAQALRSTFPVNFGCGSRERERVVWRALVAPHTLRQILWCVAFSHGAMSIRHGVLTQWAPSCPMGSTLGPPGGAGGPDRGCASAADCGRRGHDHSHGAHLGAEVRRGRARSPDSGTNCGSREVHSASAHF